MEGGYFRLPDNSNTGAVRAIEAIAAREAVLLAEAEEVTFRAP